MILCFWEVCVVLRRHKYGRKHTENVRFTRYSVPKYPKTFRFALISIISMKHIFQKTYFSHFRGNLRLGNSKSVEIITVPLEQLIRIILYLCDQGCH